MIGRLTGAVLDCSPGRLLLDVSGVGYDVQISLHTFYALSAARETTASLHIHTHVREDALQLYGFSSVEERTTFETLIGISGVGPRLALAILSGIGVDDLVQAIVQQDRARLQKIPGVGKKTAERLLLELRDRVGMPAEALAVAATAGPRSAIAVGTGPDAVSALLNLGYPRAMAERAVRDAVEGQGAEATLESVLKGALGKLVR